MLVPDHIRDAAQEGDTAVVEAFLDAEPGAVNELAEDDLPLVMATANNAIEERHVQCARMLITRGADVNIGISGWTLLHYACHPGGCASSMVSLVLQAGARVNARTAVQGMTPLGQLIVEFDYLVDEEDEDDRRQVSRSGLEIMKLMLKAGASIYRCKGDLSAENLMQDFLNHNPNYANDVSFARCREILAGVRAHGSYKAYVREPHRRFLRLRSLLVRGRIKVQGRTTKDSRRLERLARLPNGACWHVLSFLWEAA